MDSSRRRVVEAKSHLPLMTLAANPPRYPRNPSKALLEPLVLYIVRVPGSRDVFLSPLKPPTESSITSELIKAALYYIHVATPEDEAVLRAIEKEKHSNKFLPNPHQSSSCVTRLNCVNRKPAPGANTQTRENKRHSIPRRPVSSERNIPSEDAQAWDPRIPDAQVPNSQNESRWKRHLPLRKPLPPPPTGSSNAALPQPAPNTAESIAEEVDPRWREQSINSIARSNSESLTSSTVPTMERQHNGRASWHDGGSSITSERPQRQSFFRPSHLLTDQISRNCRISSPFSKPGRRRMSVKARELPPPFHLTLIRRDTTNDHQWNVGTITNCASSSSPDVALDGTIAIEILTPGYKKLAGERMPLFPTERHTPSTSTNGEPLKFIRHLTFTSPQSRRNGHGHIWTSSSSSLSLDLAYNKDPPASKIQRGKYYSFTSPWEGICTFTTSVNGRTLKCKHTIPNSIPSLAGLNLPTTTNSDNPDDPKPRLNLQQLQSALESSAAAASSAPSTQGSTVTAAEIRFNLPMFSSQNSGHNSKSNTPYTSHDATNETALIASVLRSRAEGLAGRLDLSLGRERAGGGAFGKSAKLGKLIIEDEGLKMLDLVVAACMGVWWGVYDGLC
ncbi:hypothetical protein GX48_02458 [Paracoccidioides brasiliensis]|nr:hypothetical protein GX48_02458 [Paracoccidioides brasiliensis]